MPISLLEKYVDLSPFRAAAAAPRLYAEQWKARTGGRIVAAFPMHFPGELIHAAGALPIVLQEETAEISVGHSRLFPFYCGFSRSVVDQALRGELGFADAVVLGDTCVQILGAADVVRVEQPDTPVYFFQLLACMRDSWTFENVSETVAKARRGVERMLDVGVSDDQLWRSIEVFNHNRAQLRELYALRRRDPLLINAADMQALVKSSLVMDKEEHSVALGPVIAAAREHRGSPPTGAARVYLSGHMCHAPKPELLALIEEAGAIVVDDDLYTGFRAISTDIEAGGDPVEAIARYYVAKNTRVPDPTKIDPEVDWDGFLLRAVEESRAHGLIVLMPKYCEPHMYYYPEIKEAFEARGIPHLLVETEHEAAPLESLRTRVEAFIELALQRTHA